MRRRSTTMVAVLVAASLAGAAPGRAAPGEPAEPEQRFLLSCTGAMAADGRARADRADPAHRIVASAVVDLSAGNVNGFGIGAVPIVTVTPAMIGFGTAAVDAFTLASKEPEAKPKSGTVVEGSIDRFTGTATVVVHPADDLGRVLIAMSLDCRTGLAPD